MGFLCVTLQMNRGYQGWSTAQDFFRIHTLRLRATRRTRRTQFQSQLAGYPRSRTIRCPFKYTINSPASSYLWQDLVQGAEQNWPDMLTINGPPSWIQRSAPPRLLRSNAPQTYKEPHTGRTVQQITTFTRNDNH